MNLRTLGKILIPDAKPDQGGKIILIQQIRIHTHVNKDSLNTLLPPLLSTNSSLKRRFDIRSGLRIFGGFSSAILRSFYSLVRTYMTECSHTEPFEINESCTYDFSETGQ